ncbi:UbiH/UbiF/VisC/COQ6 family ubiquinone biosynthesis hydroxylase [Sphingomonas sp. CJ99]
MEQTDGAAATATADVLILGGGLVGSALAIALDAHGLSSIVVDPADPEVILAASFDGRASAVSSSSWRMLSAIGVTGIIAEHGCPITAIRATDGLARGTLDFLTEGGDDALGTMVENWRLKTALYQGARDAALVDQRMKTRAVKVDRGPYGVTATLSDGTSVRAALLVGADGRPSPTREAAAIPVARWSYDHVAMITAFHHEIPHNNVAFEIFYPAGPFAILPMLDDEHGHRSALVWTVEAAEAPGMLKLSERAYLAEAEKRMGGVLGKIWGLAPRSSYPLGFHHAARITAERLALVGDAGHGIHPIAGQGVNLGFRDAAALTEVLVEGKRLGLDLGDPQLLDRYQRWRGLDTFLVALATDSLTRIYGVPGKAASAIRRFGMSAIDKLPPIKNRLMAEARGESGKLPRLLNGERIA